MGSTNKTKVWDPLVRIFHWTLVGSFFIAFFTEDDLLNLHVWAGYLISSLLIIRLIWGFIGSHHARFSSFIVRPSMAWNYTKDVMRFKAKRHIGHNPAGGLMVVMLLLSVAVTSITGIAVYGIEEQAGPMASLYTANHSLGGELLEELHEFFANGTLFLVALHVAGVLIASLQHHENLIRAMFDGWKNTSAK